MFQTPEYTSQDSFYTFVTVQRVNSGQGIFQHHRIQTGKKKKYVIWKILVPQSLPLNVPSDSLPYV